MVWNFGAGPAIIAPDVLGKVKEEFLDWHGSKMSIVELSHRSKEFESVLGFEFFNSILCILFTLHSIFFTEFFLLRIEKLKKTLENF